jgi:hypothetical protein
VSGPVPKRSEQRRRRNKGAGGEVTSAAGAVKVDVPPAEPDWHSLAVDWYESLAKSGQSAFYEPSDWATARFVAEAMSRNLNAGRFSAQLFAAVMVASTALLVTEGDRRRMRVELERASAVVDADEEAAVAELDEWRDRLSG